MNQFQIIKQEWERCSKSVIQAGVFNKILTGDFTIEQYKAALRQIYFHARENPQIQALATCYFRGPQRKCIKPFFRHALSEIGHDQLALNDLIALGEDISELTDRKPLPATMALISFAFYQIQYIGAVGYLGYLFHLEFTPTQYGAIIVERLMAKGIPVEALTFLHEHATVDLAHNRLMQDYVAQLVQTKKDLDDVIYATQVTAELYSKMLEAAFNDEKEKCTPEQMANPVSFLSLSSS